MGLSEDVIDPTLESMVWTMFHSIILQNLGYVHMSVPVRLAQIAVLLSAQFNSCRIRSASTSKI